MVCKKCNESGVLCEVLNKQYYYCRTCKEEIDLEIKLKSNDSFEVDFTFNQNHYPACTCYTCEQNKVKLDWTQVLKGIP